MQTDHHNDIRADRGIPCERSFRLSHELGKFVIHDLDRHLSGRHALEHILSETFLRDSGNEFFRHLTVYIGLQERVQHLFHRFRNIRFRKGRDTAQFPQRLLQSVGQIIKHDLFFLLPCVNAAPVLYYGNNENTSANCQHSIMAENGEISTMVS